MSQAVQSARWNSFSGATTYSNCSRTSTECNNQFAVIHVVNTVNIITMRCVVLKLEQNQ